jgi:hypothetical protein
VRVIAKPKHDVMPPPIPQKWLAVSEAARRNFDPPPPCPRDLPVPGPAGQSAAAPGLRTISGKRSFSRVCVYVCPQGDQPLRLGTIASLTP